MKTKSSKTKRKGKTSKINHQIKLKKLIACHTITKRTTDSSYKNNNKKHRNWTIVIVIEVVVVVVAVDVIVGS